VLNDGVMLKWVDWFSRVSLYDRLGWVVLGEEKVARVHLCSVPETRAPTSSFYSPSPVNVKPVMMSRASYHRGGVVYPYQSPGY